MLGLSVCNRDIFSLTSKPMLVQLPMASVPYTKDIMTRVKMIPLMTILMSEFILSLEQDWEWALSMQLVKLDSSLATVKKQFVNL